MSGAGELFCAFTGRGGWGGLGIQRGGDSLRETGGVSEFWIKLHVGARRSGEQRKFEGGEKHIAEGKVRMGGGVQGDGALRWRGGCGRGIAGFLGGKFLCGRLKPGGGFMSKKDVAVGGGEGSESGWGLGGVFGIGDSGRGEKQQKRRERSFKKKKQPTNPQKPEGYKN